MIFIPSKIFPCDCMGEGLTITPLTDKEDISEGEVLMSESKDLRNCVEAPFFQLSFWEFGVCRKPRWNWWWRLKIAWWVFKKGSPWPDQVILTAAHAKNFANHLLYLIGKAQKEIKSAEEQDKTRVKLDTIVGTLEESLANNNKPHCYYCSEHGGTKAGEIVNAKNEVSCPQCLPQIQIDDIGLDLVEPKNTLSNLRPLLCVQHGGSPHCEKVNKDNGFKCPKCTL